jgi:hypothetical protein
MRLGTCLSGVAVGVALSCAGGTQERASGEAEVLFREGREDFKQGNTEAACKKFAASNRLQLAAGPLLNIARCDEEVYARLASAWLHYQEAVALLACGDDRLELVKARIASLDPRVPRLQVQLAPNAPLATRILLDGVSTTVEPWTPLRVDPGERMIVVSAPGRQLRELRVMVREGQSLAVTVEPGPPILPAEPSAAQTRARTYRTIGFAVGAVGVSALLAGTLSEIVLVSKNSTVNDNCDSSKHCNQQGADAAAEGRALTTVDRVLWGVGVVGVAAGAYLVWKNRDGVGPAMAIQARSLAGGGAALIGGAF